MTDLRPEEALGHVAAELSKRRKRFALVGGLAVSVRGEVRTTRDVDLAVAVADDMELESLVADLATAGYRPVATVEQEARKRLAVVRLESPMTFRVDLLAASCGIEPEIVAAATAVAFDPIGPVPVAIAEDLLAMKLLAAREGRARDWDDALGLLRVNVTLDLELVRRRLTLISDRGFARNEDLSSKLDLLLARRDAD
ncbi:MAG TPA: nucleotidyl transferase AbiEii/AbiGii toxin family protein [Myxococcales bacterium]|jgi:predicted nucleotidyltransferase